MFVLVEATALGGLPEGAPQLQVPIFNLGEDCPSPPLVGDLITPRSYPPERALPIPVTLRVVRRTYAHLDDPTGWGIGWAMILTCEDADPGATRALLLAPIAATEARA